jgi:hypothetical protein
MRQNSGGVEYLDDSDDLNRCDVADCTLCNCRESPLLCESSGRSLSDDEDESTFLFRRN